MKLDFLGHDTAKLADDSLHRHEVYAAFVRWHGGECLAGRAFDVPVNVLDIAHAQKHLAWSPRVSFEAGLARTLRWLSNPR